MKLIKFLFIPFFLLIAPNLLAQMYYAGDVTLRGMYSTDEKLPFWMYHNERGRIQNNSNFAGWITGTVGYELDMFSSFEIGAGVLVQDGVGENYFMDELYAHYESERMYATVGRKQQKIFYNGLSASNRSILWSTNARPIPGIQVGTNGPIYFGEDNSGFGIEGSWNEYLLGEHRIVSNGKIHHKNILLAYKTKNDLEIKAGLQHFAQWGGVTATHGPEPESFSDYLKIITGREGGENAREGDQMSALGNHLGGYELFVKKTFRDYSLELLYNHIFEDGSGRRLGNTPDGRYGIYYQNTETDRIINSMIYEIYYTRHQSSTTTGEHRADNYFNHGTYREGWTYQQRMLGAPFFRLYENRVGIRNNKFVAHHLGIGGQFSNFFVTYPYKLMLSYAYNEGLFPNPLDPKQDVFYVHTEFGIFRKFIDLDVHLGAEYNSYASPIYGVGIQLRKTF